MLKHIRFSNIGLFPNFETACSRVNIVTGDNGDGKSTFIDAITALLDDHNPDLITIGAEQGETFFEFSSGLTVRHTMTHNGSDYNIRTGSGEKIVKGKKAFLRSMVTGVALDPMKLLTCSTNELIEYLLEVSGVTFSPEEVSAVTGDTIKDSMSLKQFDGLKAAKEELRSQQNQLVAVSRGHLISLENTLPSNEPEDSDWTRESQRLQTDRDAATNRLLAFENTTNNKLATDLEAIRILTAQTIEEARLEFERKKAELQRVEAEERTRLIVVARDEIEQQKRTMEPEIGRLSSELSVARERARRQSEVQALRKSVESVRAEFQAQSHEATRRQRVVESMRDLRKRKVSNLGLAGVEIREDNNLYVDGRKFSGQTNTAERIKVAFAIAAMGLKECRIMVSDRGDQLNNANLAWIAAAAEDADCQVFITRRCEGQKGLRIVPYEEYSATLTAHDQALVG